MTRSAEQYTNPLVQPTAAVGLRHDHHKALVCAVDVQKCMSFVCVRVWVCISQGDINLWVAVLDHFDSFFEQRVSQRSDVQLFSNGEAPDPAFPTAACLAVLSTTCVLLENCSNKAAYNSSEVGQGGYGWLWVYVCMNAPEVAVWTC